ncbi:hypothetical protein Taro_020259 [Colocasia esculenta]|uniref:Pentatricopeptide repeat-containing protein n=1 Tax=Colocasia esculenta TaxID=4460 RepID=A0A843UVZ7_COLES|nr:hypothetical protein [Colocasia esculenta]
MLRRRPPPLLPPYTSILLARLCASRQTSAPAAAVHGSHYPWVAKVVSTVFLLFPSQAAAAARLAVLREAIFIPSVAVLAIRRLGSPKLAVEFFKAARSICCGDSSLAAATYEKMVVRMLCQSGHKGIALEIFERMPRRHPVDCIILECLVNSFAQAGELDTAMGLLRRAPEFGCQVPAYVNNNLMSQLMGRGRVQEVVDFFVGQLGSLYFTPDTCSFNITIKGLLKMGEIDKALEFAKDMDKFHCRPDKFTHNILIDGLCKANRVERGHEILRDILLNRSGEVNVITYTSIISGYCRVGKMMEACCAFDDMVNSGIRPNQVTYNILINGYGKAGDMASAVSMYENMVAQGCSPDVVTFTSLIDGYCRSGQVDDALKIWHGMCEKGVRPNAYTFAVVVNALCKVNRVSEARDLLTEMKGRTDIVPKPFIYNPVLDGFCKAGNIEDANLIFREMVERKCSPDTVTYTVLIIGHCMKGRMSEAIALFDKMGQSGCSPDNITVRSLISCLLKAGMPSEANRIMLSVSGKKLDRDFYSSSSNPIIIIAAGAWLKGQLSCIWILSLYSIFNSPFVPLELGDRN